MSEVPQSLGDQIMGRAKRHFGDIGLRHVDVPEWGETPEAPLRIYYKPITLSEKQAFLREAAMGGGGEYGAVKAIIDKALDADGKRIFDLSHRIVMLKSAYGPVVERLSEELMRTDLKPAEPEAPPAGGANSLETKEKN
jgi:hypothetical protein